VSYDKLSRGLDGALVQSITTRSKIATVTLVILGFSLSGFAQKARDPGIRDSPRAGEPLPGLADPEFQAFIMGEGEFVVEHSVQGTIPDTESGLGPRFNANSCAACHAYPAPGGASPKVNPLFEIAVEEGASNQVPNFFRLNGPVLVPRFKSTTNFGQNNTSAQNLFTISGRSDALGCDIRQPGFILTGDNKELSFRTPPPLYGSGLIEAIPDADIIANASANMDVKMTLGIKGTANRSTNDGSITRFGWKAQNGSLLLFAAESYNVEMGVTNELFPQKRDQTYQCLFNAVPDDRVDITATVATDVPSNIERFAEFMRFLAPLTPAANALSFADGQKLFASVGCSLCHTPSFRTTANSLSAALRWQTVNLYSDLLLHDMGSGLDDGVVQGNAGTSMFRTAPLWGLGELIFFLHDGRTTDLLEAIQLHSGSGSEANEVVSRFSALPELQKQQILNFLRAL
jgi:CxxC motif-containing protein (DUF1111 family)